MDSRVLESVLFRTPKKGTPNSGRNISFHFCLGKCRALRDAYFLTPVRGLGFWVEVWAPPGHTGDLEGENWGVYCDNGKENGNYDWVYV